MSSEWNETTVGDFCPFSYGKALPERDRKYGIFPVISSAGFVGVHNNHLVNKPGVVIGRKGTVGNVTYSENPFWAIDTAFYVADEPEIRDIRFVYFMLKTLGLNQMNSDSAVPGLNRDNAHALPIVIPPIQIQREIADHLQMLDDRITLLLETNTTLEAIAQALFKSWFVDFDPVRAKQEGREPEGMDADTAALFPDSFEESELGLVPKGWKIGKVDNILSRLSAKVRYTKDQIITDGVIPIYEQGAGILLGYHNGPAQFLADERNPAFIFGDHTCVTHLSCEPFDISQNVIPLKGKDRATLWVYYAVKDKQAFQEYRRHWMELIVKDIVIPTPQICEAYANIVSIYHLKMESNVHQLRTITSIRDTLLPRLISGQLRIPEAEALIEETAA